MGELERHCHSVQEVYGIQPHLFHTNQSTKCVCVCVCVCVIVCVYFSTTFQLASLLRRTASLRERVRINEISAALLSTTSLFCTVVPNSP